jgi:glycosyltransferase involved in cell wall biosynthesis
LLYPRKSVYITFHGWEGIYPIPIKSLFQKKLGSIFCKKSIAVGKYLEKYNNIKADLITYNGVEVPQKTSLKKKNSVVYVGRLEKNTGLEIMLQAFELLPNCKVDFYGDGELRDECKKYGVVHGFVNNPEKFVAKAHFCLAGGYLACFEAFANKAQVFVCYQNQLRRDTFLFTPFRKYITLTSSPVELANKLQYYMKHNNQSKKITNEAYAWVKRYSWSKVINQYKRIWELSE